MSQQALQSFIDAVRSDPALQERLSTTAAADVDVVAEQARQAGFDVVSRDFVDHGDGTLVEYEDEDYFLRSSWWTLG